MKTLVRGLAVAHNGQMASDSRANGSAMLRPGLVIACLFASTHWLKAASPNPEDLAAPPEIQVKARVLVDRLGSEDFAVREDAQKQLAALGRLARPALLVGVNTHPSQEVRLRCAELLPHATALDIRAKLDTFLADVNGEYEHDLPGWMTFRASVCREWVLFGQVVWSNRTLDKAARQVFASMIATPANRRLLLAVDGSQVELAERVASRRQELFNERYPRDRELPVRDPTIEDITTLLFAESLVGSQLGLRRRSSIGSLMSASGFMGAVRGKDEKAAVYRALAIAWLNSRNEPREMYQALSIASSLDLNDEACGLAVRLLTMPGLQAIFRGRAASYLASNGSKKHLPLLEKGMSDTLVVASIRPTTRLQGSSEEDTHDVQLRDLVLVVSILLAEQKPEDYGFTDLRANVKDEPTYYPSFLYNRYYFADETVRKKAFAKWADWRKANANE